MFDAACVEQIVWLAKSGVAGVEIISRRCGVVGRCCGGANKMFRHGKELWRVLNSCWQRQIKKRGWLLVLQSDLDEKMCRQLR